MGPHGGTFLVLKRVSFRRELRKKHQDAVTEMGEQIDLLQKAKNK